MNKFAIVFLTAAMTLGSGAAMAADSGSNNGSANAAADAGAVAPGSKEHLQPNGVDNSKINTGESGTPATGTTGGSDMSASEVHKNTECKDGKCPDINNKVGDDANHKTDGTTH